MKQTRPCLLTVIVFGALVAGCATTQQFYVNVDSLAHTDSSAKPLYVLLPGNKGVTVGDLQFQEYASYVHRALAARGFAHARRMEDAHIAVFLSYGIGDPQTHVYSYALPVWGQTGHSGQTTYGTLNTFGPYGTYSSATTYTPTYGITGYSTHIATHMAYFRFILLDAYDVETYKRERKLAQVWRSTITSTGSSGDLRRVFPVMVAGSWRHLVANTGRKIEIVLDEEHPAVQYIKGISRR